MTISTYEQRIVGLEQNISVITRENENLKSRIRELEDGTRRIGEYESKITLLSQ